MVSVEARFDRGGRFPPLQLKRRALNIIIKLRLEFLLLSGLRVMLLIGVNSIKCCYLLPTSRFPYNLLAFISADSISERNKLACYATSVIAAVGLRAGSKQTYRRCFKLCGPPNLSDCGCAKSRFVSCATSVVVARGVETGM